MNPVANRGMGGLMSVPASASASASHCRQRDASSQAWRTAWRKTIHSALRSALRISAPLVLCAAGSLWALDAAVAAPRVQTVARGLVNPWGVAPLPDGRFLVTERPGRLRLVQANGRLSPPVTGLPEVVTGGQGGLLDVVLDPAFASNQLVYWSYSESAAKAGATAASVPQPTPQPQANPPSSGAMRVMEASALGGPNTTAVARGRLDWSGPVPAMREVQVIFRQMPALPGHQHFGSRLAFAPDGRLFITLGERFTHANDAQRLDNHLGKVIRIESDGRVPSDNPLAGRADALADIWSWGHRHVQGAAIHPGTGQLWTSEHGPQGGDELNVDLPGRNYGWPQITTGRNYGTGTPIGEGTARDDVEPPVAQWSPISIAPSGMAFLTSDRYPGWRGQLFMGTLRAQVLLRMELKGNQVVKQTRLLPSLNERIRDVRQGADGWLYLLTDNADGRLLRLLP